MVHLHPSWKSYEHLLYIWETCGASPFLASYLHDGNSIKSWASRLRIMKMVGAVKPNGRVHHSIPTMVWQITPGTRDKLIKKVGPASPEAEEACRKYTDGKIAELVELRSMRVNVTPQERDENIAAQIKDGLVVIREMYPSQPFTYADIMPRLLVKNTRLLGAMESRGMVARVGTVKSNRSNGKKVVTLWQLKTEAAHG